MNNIISLCQELKLNIKHYLDLNFKNRLIPSKMLFIKTRTVSINKYNFNTNLILVLEILNYIIV